MPNFCFLAGLEMAETVVVVCGCVGLGGEHLAAMTHFNTSCFSVALS